MQYFVRGDALLQVHAQMCELVWELESLDNTTFYYKHILILVNMLWISFYEAKLV